MVVRTRSQGLTASVAQDLERDLLMAAVSLDDTVVVDLRERHKKFIVFRSDDSLKAVRNKLPQADAYLIWSPYRIEAPNTLPLA